METISVNNNKLKKLIGIIKEQKMPVKIYNHHAHGERFLRIEEIKDISHGEFKVTIAIIYDPVSEDSTVMDVKTISLMELQEPLEFEGRKVQFVKIEKDVK